MNCCVQGQCGARAGVPVTLSRGQCAVFISVGLRSHPDRASGVAGQLLLPQPQLSHLQVTPELLTSAFPTVQETTDEFSFSLQAGALQILWGRRCSGLSEPAAGTSAVCRWRRLIPGLYSKGKTTILSVYIFHC